MRRECAWCKKDMGLVLSTNPGDVVVTHTICMECSKKMFADISADVSVEMTRFLDTLGAPVLVVDAAGVVRAANHQAQTVLGKKLPEIQGQLGGDVFACAYARLPGGCGNTGHCEACTIRQAVMDTYRTGTGCSRRMTHLDRGTIGDKRRLRFVISTEKQGECVVLRIDEGSGGKITQA